MVVTVIFKMFVFSTVEDDFLTNSTQTCPKVAEQCLILEMTLISVLQEMKITEPIS